MNDNAQTLRREVRDEHGKLAFVMTLADDHSIVCEYKTKKVRCRWC